MRSPLRVYVPSVIMVVLQEVTVASEKDKALNATRKRHNRNACVLPMRTIL